MADDHRWLKYYDPTVTPNLKVDGNFSGSFDLYQLFSNAVNCFGRQTALVFLGNNITYNDLNAMVDRYAQALLFHGIRPGCRVGIQLPNCPQFAAAYFAAFKLGAIPVPIDMRLDCERVRNILIVTDPSLVITLSRNAALVFEAARSLDFNCPVAFTSIKKYMGWPAWMYFSFFIESKDQHPISANLVSELIDWDYLETNQWPTKVKLPPHGNFPQATALIQYTGGITGVPRPIAHSNSSLAASFYQSRNWLVNFKEGSEVVAAILPWTHIYGQVTTLLTGLLTGSKLIVEPDPTNPDFWQRFVRLLCAQRVSVFPAVPFFFEKIIKLPIAHARYLRSLKLCISGGTALSTDLKDAFERVSQSLVINGYGLSECPIAAINPVYTVSDADNIWRRAARDNRRGSVGLPVQNTEIKIINPSPDGVGELAVRGPQVMIGYWCDFEATNLVLNDGWLRTRDFGKVDDYGFVYIGDRVNDAFCFKNTGTKIFPTPIETAIARHSDIQDVAVVGLSYGYGLVPVACVVLKPGVNTKLDDLKDSIIRLCRGSLNEHEIPRYVFIVSEIPKSALGKPIRRLVREMIIK